MRKEDYLRMAGYPNTPEGEAAFYKEYDTPEKFEMKFGGTTAFPQARTEQEFFNFGAPMRFSNVVMKDGGSPFPAVATANQFFQYGVPAPDMMMFQNGGQTVSEIWKQKTGLPWSEAKKRGLTDGSYDSNIALKDKLMKGEFNQEIKDPYRKKIADITNTLPKAKKVASVKSASPYSINSEAEYKASLLQPYSPEKRAAQTAWINSKKQSTAKTLSKSESNFFTNIVDSLFPDATPVSKEDAKNLASSVKKEARSLESGMIEDKNKNLMYVVQKGKVTKTFPIGTGSAKDMNYNPYSVQQLESFPEGRSTPVGTYLSVPNPNIYGVPGFNKVPIPAFGLPAPIAANTAQHIVYGTGPKGTSGYDPEEGAKRLKKMQGPGEQRNFSYGCTNMYGQDIDCLTGQLFPQGDTTIVVDTRNPKDQAFLKGFGVNEMKYGGLKGGPNEMPCFECGGYMKKQMGGEAEMGSEQEEIVQIINMFAQMNGVAPEEIIEQLMQLDEQQQQQAIMQMAQAIQGGGEEQMSEEDAYASQMMQQGMEEQMPEEQMAEEQMPEEGMMQVGGESNYTEGADSYLGKTKNFINYLRDTAAMANIKETYPFLMKRGGSKMMAEGGANELEFNPYSNWQAFQEAYEASDTQPGFRENLGAFFGGNFDDMRTDGFTPYNQYLIQQEEERSEDTEEKMYGGMPYAQFGIFVQDPLANVKKRLAQQQSTMGQQPSFVPYRSAEAKAESEAYVRGLGDSKRTQTYTTSIPSSRQQQTQPQAQPQSIATPTAGAQGTTTGTTGATSTTAGTTGTITNNLPAGVNVAGPQGTTTTTTGTTTQTNNQGTTTQTTTDGTTTRTARRPTGGLWDLLPIAWQPYQNVKVKGNFPAGYEGFAGPLTEIDIKDLKTRNPFFWGSGTPSLKRFKGRLLFGPGSQGATSAVTTTPSTTQSNMGPQSENDIFTRWEASGIPDSDLQGMDPAAAKAMKDRFEAWKTKGEWSKTAGKFDRLFNNPQGKQILQTVYPGLFSYGARSSSPAVGVTNANGSLIRTNPPQASSNDDFYGLSPREEADLEESVDILNKAKARGFRMKQYGGMQRYAPGGQTDQNYVDLMIRQGLRPTNQSIADLSLMGVNMLTGIGNDIEAAQRKRQFRSKMQDPTSLFNQSYDMNRGDYATNWNSFRPNQLNYAGPYAQTGGVFVNGMTQFLTTPVIKKINNIGGNTYE